MCGFMCDEGIIVLYKIWAVLRSCAMGTWPGKFNAHMRVDGV